MTKFKVFLKDNSENIEAIFVEADFLTETFNPHIPMGRIEFRNGKSVKKSKLVDYVPKQLIDKIMLVSQ